MNIGIPKRSVGDWVGKLRFSTSRCRQAALLLGLLALAFAWRAMAEPAGPVSDSRALLDSGSLVTHVATLQEHEQLTIIDPQARVIAVYHIDAGSGEISLRSVRDFRWDLQMEEFNNANPRPREVRVAVEQH